MTEAEALRQYARAWRLMREHAGQLNSQGWNLLLDVVRLRGKFLTERGYTP